MTNAKTMTEGMSLHEVEEFLGTRALPGPTLNIAHDTRYNFLIDGHPFTVHCQFEVDPEYWEADQSDPNREPRFLLKRWELIDAID